MTDRLVVVVHGTPAPQGSKTAMPGGGLIESSKRVGPWREAIRHEAANAATKAGWVAHTDASVHVAVVFTLARPRGHYGTGRNAHNLKGSAPDQPTGTPDLDKLLRATLDALTDAAVLADDARVVALDAAKTYPAGHLDALDTAGAVLVITQNPP